MYHSSSNAVGEISLIFLSPKTWTFSAIPVNTSGADPFSCGFARTFCFFIVCVHFCRRKHGLLEQFFFRISIYRNSLDIIDHNPSIFLSLKTWTFGAMLVNAGGTDLCLP